MAASKGDADPQKVAAKPPEPFKESIDETWKTEDFLKAARLVHEMDPGLFHDPSGFPPTLLSPHFGGQPEPTDPSRDVIGPPVKDNPVDAMKFLSDKLQPYTTDEQHATWEQLYGPGAKHIASSEVIGDPRNGGRILINRPLPTPNGGNLINEPLPTPAGPRILINTPPPGSSSSHILINAPLPGTQGSSGLRDRNTGPLISRQDFVKMLLDLSAHQHAVARGLSSPLAA